MITITFASLELSSTVTRYTVIDGGFPLNYDGNTYLNDGLVVALDKTVISAELANVTQNITLFLDNDVKNAIQTDTYRNRRAKIFKGEWNPSTSSLSSVRSIYEGLIDTHNTPTADGTVEFIISSLISPLRRPSDNISLQVLHNQRLEDGVYGAANTNTIDTFLRNAGQSFQDFTLGASEYREAVTKPMYMKVRKNMFGNHKRKYIGEELVSAEIQETPGSQLENPASYQPARVYGISGVNAAILAAWNHDPASDFAQTKAEYGTNWRGFQDTEASNAIRPDTRFGTIVYLVHAGEVDSLNIYFDGLNGNVQSRSLSINTGSTSKRYLKDEYKDENNVTRNNNYAAVEVLWGSNNQYPPTSWINTSNGEVDSSFLGIGYVLVAVTYEATRDGAVSRGIPKIGFQVKQTKSVDLSIPAWLETTITSDTGYSYDNTSPYSTPSFYVENMAFWFSISSKRDLTTGQSFKNAFNGGFLKITPNASFATDLNLSYGLDSSNLNAYNFVDGVSDIQITQGSSYGKFKVISASRNAAGTEYTLWLSGDKGNNGTIDITQTFDFEIEETTRTGSITASTSRIANQHPARIILDYLIDKQVGPGLSVDDIDLRSFLLCQENAAKIPQYINGVMQGQDTFVDYIQDIADTANLTIYQEGDKIKCRFRKPIQSSNVAVTFNEDNCSDMNLINFRNEDKFNEFILTVDLQKISNVKAPRITDFPIETRDTNYLSNDNGIRSIGDFTSEWLTLFYSETVDANGNTTIELDESESSEHKESYEQYARFLMDISRFYEEIELTTTYSIAKDFTIGTVFDVENDLYGFTGNNIRRYEVVDYADNHDGTISLVGQRHSNAIFGLEDDFSNNVFDTGEPTVVGYTGFSTEINPGPAQNLTFVNIKNHANPPRMNLQFDVSTTGITTSFDIYRDSNTDDTDGQQYVGTLNNVSGFNPGETVTFQIIDPEPIVHYYRVVARNGELRSTTSKSAEINATGFGPLGTVNYYASGATPPTTIPPEQPWVSPEQYDSNVSYDYIVRGVRNGDASQASLDINGTTSQQYFDYTVSGSVTDTGLLTQENLEIEFDLTHDTSQPIRRIATDSSLAGDNAGIVLSSSDDTTTSTAGNTTTRSFEDINYITGLDVTATTTVSAVSTQTGTTMTGSVFDNASQWSTNSSAPGGAGTGIRTASGTGNFASNTNAFTVSNPNSLYNITNDARIDDTRHYTDTGYWANTRTHLLTSDVSYDFSSSAYRDLYSYTGNSTYSTVSSPKVLALYNDFYNFTYRSGYTGSNSIPQNWRFAPDNVYRAGEPSAIDDNLDSTSPTGIYVWLGSDLGLDTTTPSSSPITNFNQPLARDTAGGTFLPTEFALLDTNGTPIYDTSQLGETIGGFDNKLRLSGSYLNSKGRFYGAWDPETTASTPAEAASGDNLHGILGLSWQKYYNQTRANSTVIDAVSVQWEQNLAYNDLYILGTIPGLVNGTKHGYLTLEVLTSTNGNIGINTQQVNNVQSSIVQLNGQTYTKIPYMYWNMASVNHSGSGTGLLTFTVRELGEDYSILTNNHPTRTMRLFDTVLPSGSTANYGIAGHVNTFVILAPGDTWDTRRTVPSDSTYIYDLPLGRESTIDGSNISTNLEIPTIYYDWATDLKTIRFNDFYNKTWEIEKDTSQKITRPTINSFDTEVVYLMVDYHKVSLKEIASSTEYELTAIPTNVTATLTVDGSNTSLEGSSFTLANDYENMTVTGTTPIDPIIGTLPSSDSNFPVLLEDADGIEGFDVEFISLSGGYEVAPAITRTDQPANVTVNVNSGVNLAGSYTVNQLAPSVPFGLTSGLFGLYASEGDPVRLGSLRASSGNLLYDSSAGTLTPTTTNSSHGWRDDNGIAYSSSPITVKAGTVFTSSNNPSAYLVATSQTVITDKKQALPVTAYGTIDDNEDPWAAYTQEVYFRVSRSTSGSSFTSEIVWNDESLKSNSSGTMPAPANGTMTFFSQFVNQTQNYDYGSTFDNFENNIQSIVCNNNVITITHDAPYTKSGNTGRGFGNLIVVDSAGSFWELRVDNWFFEGDRVSTPSGYADCGVQITPRRSVELTITPNTADGWQGGTMSLTNRFSNDRVYTLSAINTGASTTLALLTSYEFTVGGFTRTTGQGQISLSNNSDTYLEDIQIDVEGEVEEVGTLAPGASTSLDLTVSPISADYQILLGAGAKFSLTIGEDVHLRVPVSANLDGAQSATFLKDYFDNTILPNNATLTALGTTAVVVDKTITFGPLGALGENVEPVSFSMEGPTNATLSFNAIETDGSNQKVAVDVTYQDRADDGFIRNTVVGTHFPNVGTAEEQVTALRLFLDNSFASYVRQEDASSTDIRSHTISTNTALNIAGDLDFNVRYGNGTSDLAISVPTYTGPTTKDSLQITVTTPNGRSTGNLFDATMNCNMTQDEVVQKLFEIFQGEYIASDTPVNQRSDVFFEPLVVDGNTISIDAAFADENLPPVSSSDFSYTSGTGGNGSVQFNISNQSVGGNFIFTVINEPYAISNPGSYDDATRGAIIALL